MKYLMKLEYDGSDFSGWQVQPERRTIQEEIQNVLKRLFKTEIKVYSSGRTDAGVHAVGQIAHFEIEKDIDVEKLKGSLNAFLPETVRVLDLQKVSDSFDSRFCAKKKTYAYKFYLSKVERPLLAKRALRVSPDIDIKKMKGAMACLVGKHDFSSFVSKKSGKTCFVRNIFYCDIKKTDNDSFEFVICGDGFLYNMVRIIFGTLLDVGTGKINVEKFKDILESKSRKNASKCVPPFGLYLMFVEYADLYLI